MVTTTRPQPTTIGHDRTTADVSADTRDDRDDTASLIYVVPHDQLVPDLHPRLWAFRTGEAVFATGYLVGLLEAPCLTYLRRHAQAGQTPVGTRVEVAHRAPSIPGRPPPRHRTTHQHHQSPMSLHRGCARSARGPGR
ncbi:hypothetical protein [Pseudonocardia sp. ICBG1293]|uniref:thioesterase, FlK family n=1 Tax=Pseudonocardia sp. ICBG1293 TaxID=2844382 RepID=UPI001CCD4DE0|nr:hypothetical protein [Pseudonocardia sp. ICBG1293]